MIALVLHYIIIHNLECSGGKWFLAAKHLDMFQVLFWDTKKWKMTVEVVQNMIMLKSQLLFLYITILF